MVKDWLLTRFRAADFAGRESTAESALTKLSIGIPEISALAPSLQ
jgi:hypothetical protein